MPIIPFTGKPISGSSRPPIAPPKPEFALMAAAQMHAEGRLVPQSETPNDASNN